MTRNEVRKAAPNFAQNPPEQHSSSWINFVGDRIKLVGTWIKFAGTWNKLDGTWIKLDGAWIKLAGAWIKLDGAWINLSEKTLVTAKDWVHGAVRSQQAAAAR